MDPKELMVSRPCPVVDPKTGRIWVFLDRYDVALRKHRIFMAYSDNDGKTWSKPKDDIHQLWPSQKTNGGAQITGWSHSTGHGFVMQRGKYAGRLIAPINLSINDAGCTPGVIYSDDHGKTWKRGGFLISAQHLVEGMAVELCDGSILFTSRTGLKQRAFTIIPDGGNRAEVTKYRIAQDVPDPHCPAAMVRCSWPKDDKPGLIVYSGPGTDQGRYRMTLRGSYDDGKTWPWKQLVYGDGSGYSDVNVLPDGRIILLFEKDGKSSLEFVTMPAPPATPPAK